MKLLTEISDATLGIGPAESLGAPYKLRKAARAILLNDEGLIALQNLTNRGFHMLPGGGFDPGETPAEACRREVLEEVGCESEIVDEVGVAIEYREQYELIHINYCFLMKIAGQVKEPQLQPDEIEEGMETTWVTPEEALELLNADSPDPKYYEGKFIVEREKVYVAEAINLLRSL